MEQGSFEDKLRNRFNDEGVSAPEGVWSSINSKLNEQAVYTYQHSQRRYKWIAAAAVLIAGISLAFHVDHLFVKASYEESNSLASYNALLPTNTKHFRFYNTGSPDKKLAVSEKNWGHSGYYVQSPILFLESQEKSPKVLDQTGGQVKKYNESIIVFEPLLVANDLDLVKPDVKIASIEKGHVSHYYVPQYRPGTIKSTISKTTFWAGVEAGAGNFVPDYSGASSISSSADYGAIASALGQDDFVNPTASATQNSMEEGMVTSVGLDFGWKMGKKWTLESGVQYASINSGSTADVYIVDIYTISNEDLVVTRDSESPIIGSTTKNGGLAAREIEVEETVEHAVELENAIRFTSIPFKTGYFLMDKKMSLRVNAGLTANYLVSSQVNDPSGQLESANDADQYNTWSFDGITGFELGYNIFDHFNLTIEPNYRRAITPLGENLVNQSGFVIQTGLRYRLE